MGVITAPKIQSMFTMCRSTNIRYAVALLIICLGCFKTDLKADEPVTAESCSGYVNTLIQMPERIETGQVLALSLWLTTAGDEKILLTEDLMISAENREVDERLLEPVALPCGDYVKLVYVVKVQADKAAEQTTAIRLKIRADERKLLKVRLVREEANRYRAIAETTEPATGGPLLLAVSRNPNLVTLLNRQSMTLVDMMPIDAEPDAVRVDPRRNLGYVLCVKEKKILIVDMNLLRLRGSLDVPIDRIGTFAYEPNKELFAVTGKSNGEVVFVGTTGNSSASTVFLEGRIKDIEALEDGHFLALDSHLPQAYLLDGVNGRLYRKIKFSAPRDTVRYASETNQVALSSTHKAEMEFRTWPGLNVGKSCHLPEPISDFTLGRPGILFTLRNDVIHRFQETACQSWPLITTGEPEGRIETDSRLNRLFFLNSEHKRLQSFDMVSGKAMGTAPLPPNSIDFSLGPRR